MVNDISQKVVTGLNGYVNCPVIMTNQNAPPPQYPYLGYNITTLKSENRGTWQEYENEVERKSILQTWSFTAVSDDRDESLAIAQKAKDWLDNVGNTYLNDNDIIVSRVTAITNRDNILTIDYEYKNGFDCVFWLYDEINKSLITPPEQRIEKVKIGDKIIEKET